MDVVILVYIIDICTLWTNIVKRIHIIYTCSNAKAFTILILLKLDSGQFMRRGPELAAWSWSTHPDRMAALFSGLGMVAVVTSVTLKCIPLYRLNIYSSVLEAQPLYK